MTTTTKHPACKRCGAPVGIDQADTEAYCLNGHRGPHGTGYRVQTEPRPSTASSIALDERIAAQKRRKAAEAVEKVKAALAEAGTAGVDAIIAGIAKHEGVSVGTIVRRLKHAKALGLLS